MCESIAKAEIFSKGMINLRISYYDIIKSSIYMESLTLFLATSFHQMWAELDFPFIQDYEFHILYRGLKNSDINITELWLFNGCLTFSLSKLVSDIAINCRVKKLMLDMNKTIGENEELYSMLSHPSTKRACIKPNYHPKLLISYSLH